VRSIMKRFLDDVLVIHRRWCSRGTGCKRIVLWIGVWAEQGRHGAVTTTRLLDVEAKTTKAPFHLLFSPNHPQT
jgi:hypothetical protein